MQSGGFLGRPLGPLLKTSLPLMKNVLQSLAKSVLTSLKQQQMQEYTKKF